jgi:tripartite-type tricarboxylate transporter receptor subunit TctC
VAHSRRHKRIKIPSAANSKRQGDGRVVIYYGITKRNGAARVKQIKIMVAGYWPLLTVLTCLVLAVLPVSARAQADYPNKPIKVIVPFPAGGGGDILARLVLNRVGQELGKPIVFENLAGAGGNLGSVTAVRAEPDGYTLLYGTNGTLAVNHSLYKKTGFDPAKDLQPISRLSQLGLVVVVRPGLAVNSMSELVQTLKASPGKYTIGSAGNGTTSHLAGEIFKSSAGLAIVHIPYRGGAPAMTDLIGGQIDMMIEVMPSAVPQVKAGRVRALAVSTAKPVDALPNLPTVAQSGVPNFEVTAWDALTAPVGIPAAIVAKLNAAVKVALNDPEIARQLTLRGAEASYTTPTQLADFISAEKVRWGAAVVRSGATVD